VDKYAASEQIVKSETQHFFRAYWSWSRKHFLEPEDLSQQGWYALQKQKHCFDPAQGNWEAFVRRIVHNELHSLKRKTRAAKRGGNVSVLSFSEPRGANASEDDYTLGDGVTRDPKRGLSAVERNAFRGELDAMLEAMPAEHCRICELIRQGHSLSEAGQQLGISRGKLYRIRIEIADAFRNSGFSKNDILFSFPPRMFDPPRVQRGWRAAL
jgi:RNA polymerase sigma factor (sigma-70 family)